MPTYETIGEVAASTNGTTVTAGAANTKGSYAELVASSGITCHEFILEVVTQSAAASYLLDIATGGAGSETVVLSNILVGQGGSGRGSTFIRLPLSIPSGTRISARCQSTTASATMNIMGHLVNHVSLGSPTWDTMGNTTADSGGIQIDPGGTAHTKGAWVEIVASSSALFNLLALFISNQGNSVASSAQWFFDIGTGAGGAETPIISDIPFRATAAADDINPSAYLFPVSIAAGTRIAVRAQCSTADATDRLTDVILVGAEISTPAGGGPMYLLGGGGF